MRANQNKPDFSIEEFRSLFEYRPDTGKFIRLVTIRGRFMAGEEVGSLNPGGYISFCIKGRPYRAHHLAWFYMTGIWPEFLVDHRNLDPSDNRWDNLREATSAQNSANRKLSSANTSGFKGVSWDSRYRKWKSEVYVNKKKYLLGYFNNAKEAARSYDERATQLSGPFALTNQEMAARGMVRYDEMKTGDGQ